MIPTQVSMRVCFVLFWFLRNIMVMMNIGPYFVFIYDSTA